MAFSWTALFSDFTSKIRDKDPKSHIWEIEIIIEIKVILPQVLATLADFGYIV
jgi:hypothetical protein